MAKQKLFLVNQVHDNMWKNILACFCLWYTSGAKVHAPLETTNQFKNSLECKKTKMLLLQRDKKCNRSLMMMDVFQNTETKTFKALICLSVRLTLPVAQCVHLSLKKNLLEIIIELNQVISHLEFWSKQVFFKEIADQFVF